MDGIFANEKKPAEKSDLLAGAFRQILPEKNMVSYAFFA